jgi:predicted MFS family arabinose efflux permease
MSGRTLGSAFFYNSFDIGIGLGTLGMGFVAGSFKSFQAVYSLSAAIMAVTLIVYFLFYLPKNRGPASKNPSL